MSHYGNYIKEREGFNCLDCAEGFITYQIQGENCYIRDVYVAPEYRRQDVMTKMADIVLDMARDKGCKRLLGSVAPLANGSTASLKAVLSYGFQLLGLDFQQNLIMLYKDI